MIRDARPTGDGRLRAVARKTAETSLRTFEGRELSYAAGFALGLGGDAAKAEALADKLDKEYPEDTQVQASYVPTLRALVALDNRDPRKVIDLIEANRPYEFVFLRARLSISTATCTRSMFATPAWRRAIRWTPRLGGSWRGPWDHSQAS